MSIKEAVEDLKKKVKETKEELRDSLEAVRPEPIKPVRTFLQRRLPLLNRRTSSSRRSAER